MTDPCEGNACGIATRQDVAGNAQRLEQLQTLLQGVDLSLLGVINSKMDILNAKMGPQLNGGIGGVLSALKDRFDKFVEWSKIGQIMQVMTFVATLHNAYMLSNALTQTLFSMFSNVLAAVGIKDENGNPMDVQSIVGNTIENIAEQVLGVDTVDGIQENWKKYSRIYQAAANIINSLQSIGYSILEALEVVASYTGKIGNALKKFGVIGEQAFRWMNPSPDFSNRYFTAIENVSEVIESIDQVASEVLNIQETVIQLGKQREDLNTAIAAIVNDDQPENTQAATSAQEAKTQSQSPTIQPEDEQGTTGG